MRMPDKETLEEVASRIWYVSEWHTPATDYPEAQAGNFRIIHSRYTRGMYRCWGVEGYLYFKAVKPLPITVLQEKRGKHWYDWMVDDPPNYRAMQIYAQHCQGQVLCAGLGLGLIVHGLAKNPEVTGITVVEISEEVVRLMDNNWPRKSNAPLTVVISDFFDFLEHDNTPWDHIIVDLWVTSGEASKNQVFWEKVLPTGIMLGFKYPGSKVTFHGFQSVSHIKPVADKEVELINKLGGI